jgi:VanZ family protein
MSGRFFKYWLPVVVWMILIFGASTGLGRPENTSRIVRPILLWLFPHISDQAIDQVHFVVRKTAHFVEYSILGMLLWRLVHLDPAWEACRSRQYLIALLLAAFYASSDEFHQKFVPGREAAVRDVLIDTCGAGFGLAAVWAARRLRPKKPFP